MFQSSKPPAIKDYVFKIYYICTRKIPRIITMIKVSTQAREQVMQMMQLDGHDVSDSFVRVGVKSGGCSGLSYELKFDNTLGDDDKLFEDNNVRIVVDKKSFLYLVGTTLEYSGGLNGKGFVFNNPNANRTCGCGESFSL
jgi:iron-sulfur cluster assembly protein